MIQISESLHPNTNVLFSGDQGDTITLLESYPDPEPTFELTSQVKAKKLIPIFPKSDTPAQVQVVTGGETKQQQKTTNFSLPGQRWQMTC